MNPESRPRRPSVKCTILYDAHPIPEIKFCVLGITPIGMEKVNLWRTTKESLEDSLSCLGISAPVNQLPRYPVTFDGYLPDFDSLVGTDWPRDVLKKLYPDHADFWS
jgi:hypothetical protein